MTQECGKRPNDSQSQRDECSHASRLRLFQTPPKNSHLRLAELLANRLALTDPRGRLIFFSLSLCLSRHVPSTKTVFVLALR